MNSPAFAPEPRRLTRHQLVRVRTDAWDAWMDAHPDLAEEPLLRDWARHGWPLIVRRPLPGEQAGVPLGLPLPPWAGKRRLAICIAPEAIASVAPLPALTEVIATAPQAWQPCLRQLIALAASYQVQVRVFGSLAWQWLTGLSYLGPGSDLDLVWTVPQRDQLSAFLTDVAQLEATAPMRLDGELLRADGAGVNWREVHTGAAELALKSGNEVTLYPLARFLGELT
jgi:phosphoribosyl-dephospho-CoA transferase